MALRRRCFALLPFMTGFLRCCWFYVSTDSVYFSRFVISHALRYRFLAIRCPDPAAAGGVRPPAVRTTAQPYTAGGRLRAAVFCVSAWLALVFRRGRLRCSGVICNPPERNSVIALDCKSCERGTGGILDERKTRIAATDRLTVNYRNHDGVRCGARTHDT